MPKEIGQSNRSKYFIDGSSIILVILKPIVFKRERQDDWLSTCFLLGVDEVICSLE